MCVVCGCNRAGEAGYVAVNAVKPQANYVTDDQAARLAGAMFRVPDGAAGAPADGRPAAEELAGGEQAALGWGLAPATMDGDADAGLTALPSNPVGFSVRQQDAVRRDAAAAIDDYTVYQPAPFAGC